jgi:hypothetical protein
LGGNQALLLHAPRSFVAVVETWGGTDESVTFSVTVRLCAHRGKRRGSRDEW